MPAAKRTNSITLRTPVGDVPGVTREVAGSLRALGLPNVGRLIAHIPARHEWVERGVRIGAIAPDTQVTVTGEVTAARPVRFGRPRFEAVIADETGRAECVWCNMPWLTGKIVPGMFIRVQGKAKARAKGVQIANPRWNEVSEDAAGAGEFDRTLMPVYPAGEGIESGAIAAVVRAVLHDAVGLIDEHLPEEFRVSRALPTLGASYRMLHAPENEVEVEEARRRLIYDELLMLQLGVQMKRAQRRKLLMAPALRWDDAVRERALGRLPFALTAAQERVLGEIAGDLQQGTPANRLIQGDVGSGKTAVAAAAMLMAVASGHQAAMMAPTEILAEQHFESLSKMLAGSQVNVALLTGNTPTDERERVLHRLAEGQLDIAVGTHALLTERVRFASLALAIIDEQHRFGVHQRAKLRAKSEDEHTSPHVLVMTATPIPRTLAITVFGDLDVSVIDELPPGRQPVVTRVVGDEQRPDVYAHVAERIKAGEQAFVVAPSIDGEELAGVRDLAAELESTLLAGKRVAVMHGRLKRDTRERIMHRFRAGQIDVLVATTVIEVGVDVPNATVMVIENAERFGLAQLHQLRGRVGRGSGKSVCVLIGRGESEESKMRLAAMAETGDGFVLAERDMELRGPGELFGTRQSGLPPLRIADLVRDRELLRMTRRDAGAWIDRSPNLGAAAEQTLRRRLLKLYGEALGIVDVG